MQQRQDENEDNLGCMIQRKACRLVDELKKKPFAIDHFAIKSLLNFVNLIDGPKRIGLLDEEYDLDPKHPCIDDALHAWAEKTISSTKGIKEEIDIRANDRKNVRKEAEDMMKMLKAGDEKTTIDIMTRYKKYIKSAYQGMSDMDERIEQRVQYALKAIKLDLSNIVGCIGIRALRKINSSNKFVKEFIEDHCAKGWREASERRCGTNWDCEVLRKGYND